MGAAAAPNAANAVSAASAGNAAKEENAETGAREAPRKAAKAGRAGNSVHAAASADHAATKRPRARQRPRRRVKTGPAAAIVVTDRNVPTAQSVKASHPLTRAPGWWRALSARPPVRLRRPIARAVVVVVGVAVAGGTVTSQVLTIRR